MKGISILCVCALWLGACTHANNTANESANLYKNKKPLRCVDCAFVESKGVRRISGVIQSDTKMATGGLIINIELKDAEGNVVARQDISISHRAKVEPESSERFSEIVQTDQADITQATIYLKKAGSNERLSDPVTLLLIASL